MRLTTALPMRSCIALLGGRSLAMLAMAGCLCGLITARGQDHPIQSQPAPAAAAKAPDVSKEGLVLEKLYTRIRMESDGTGTRETTSRVHVLADSGVKEMAVLTFTYTASNQQVEIGYVRVIKPDGSVVVTPDYNIQEMPADVTRAAPMYSDIHQKHVAVKGLGVGDILESQVTLRTLKPEVPGQFWMEYSFEKNLIALDEQLDLDLPADKAVTVASADLQPTVTTANGRKLYHWASSNLARPDPDAPPKSTKLWKPSVQVTTFTSWEQVGAWYQSLQREPLAVTPAIQAKAAALTKGLTTDEEKLRAIFNDVALHIHYVGLDFGIGRYQPHPADDVLSNEYGDCKDKHTLLASLLKAAGIEAWPVLISSSRELDPAMPSPGQFDHVITLVPLGGKLVWMDSTEEIAPVGVLMAPLRDKQALAIPDGKPAYLERTPADLPFPQSMLFKAEGKLSDTGVFTGHIVQIYHGDGELLLRAVFRQIPQSQWKEALQRFSNATGFAGEVTNPQFSEIEQTGQPLQFSYDYTREKYGEWDDHRISPPMPPTGWELAPGVKEKKPADPPELGSPGEQIYLSSVQIPKGWSLIPQKNVDLKEDWAEYHSTYSFTDGIFKAERRVVVKKSKVPLDEWDKYLAIRRAMYDDEVRMTPIFNRAAVPGIPGSLYAFINQPDGNLKTIMEPLRDASAILSAETPASKADLDKAAGLSRKAVDAAEAQSLTLSLDDAHSLYFAGVLTYAWSALGRAALESGDLPTAENYLRAAWRLGQDNATGYRLGRLLEAKGDKNAAAHQYLLAKFATASSLSLGGGENFFEECGDSYRRLTGKDPNSAARMPGGRYEGSPIAELNKETEFHQVFRTSKVTGVGLFILVFEPGKPVQVRFLSGDQGVRGFESALKTVAFHPGFPAGSKARVLREIRLVCTPYAGCDGYMMLPNAVQIPPKDITPPDAPKGTKTFQIEVQPGP